MSFEYSSYCDCAECQAYRIPSGVNPAQREAEEAAGDGDSRDKATVPETEGDAK